VTSRRRLRARKAAVRVQEALAKCDGALHHAHWIALSIRLLLVDLAEKGKAWHLVTQHAATLADQIAEVASPEHPQIGAVLRQCGTAYLDAALAQKKAEAQGRGAHASALRGVLEGKKSADLAKRARGAFERSLKLLRVSLRPDHPQVIQVQQKIKLCELMLQR
jgi:hypothetical protein